MNSAKLAVLLYVKEPFSVGKSSADLLYTQIAEEIRNLLGLDRARFSLYLPGNLAEVWIRQNMADVVEMRQKVREGKLEIMGGGYYDAMLPLFPTALQKLQLRKHFEQMERVFQTEPVGYFNSPMAWEIGMTEVLAKQGFRYTLVSERSLQETIGLATRITGWFATEDRDSVIRLLPVAEDLGEAILLGKEAFLAKLESLGENDRIWVVTLPVPVLDSESIRLFFENLRKIFLNPSIQFWPLSHLLEEPSGGKVNLMSDMGSDTGLPPGSHSCRELLLRRPEADLMHKSLLIANSHASDLLGAGDISLVQNKLLPLMASEYYADLYDQKGVRSPVVRWKGNSLIIEVEQEIEKLAKLNGRRVEVSDFLRNGSRQILVNNSEVQFLLELSRGASLRSLIFKPSKVNLVNALRQNGEVPSAFVEHLLPPSIVNLEQIESALNDGTGILDEPYDYRIERQENSLGISLRSEQTPDLGVEQHVLHLEKEFTLQKRDRSLRISYRITNGTFANLEGYFGTVLNLGIRQAKDRAYVLKIDGKKIPLETSLPLLYPDASEMSFKDGLLSYAFRMKFSKPTKVAMNWILGSHQSAAPTFVQGVRIFLFWNLQMQDPEPERFDIDMDFSRRGFWA